MSRMMAAGFARNEVKKLGEKIHSILLITRRFSLARP